MALVSLIVLLPAIAWACAAIWFDGPSARPLAAALALGFGGLCGVVLFARRWPLVQRVVATVAALGLVVSWWLSLEPSNDRDWADEVARLPRVQFEGDTVLIENVRAFEYASETEYDAVWKQRRIDLSKVRGMDFALSYWSSPWIAHTIVSWNFEDAPPLSISIETRKERTESYSAVLGFFRQFELYYVVAEETDLIGLRTHHRQEDVYLYRLRVTADRARALLVDYLETIEALADEPRWYNAATHNCTTTIRRHVQHVAAGNPFDWRILVNGRIDELGYERGNVDTSLPFEELRRRSAISEKARERPIDGGFSAWIREGLPGGSAPR
ncbi:MAG: DUF4105 domain-containing protein [Myxococcota bacterium]|nr:DUF4105 domain-containing protein [Myxococcota bacterium]